MALLKIARLGHPILRSGTREVSPEKLASPETQRLIDDMLSTMADGHGVGLAACQVHSDLKILVVGALFNPVYPGRGATTETILANPVLVDHGPERDEDWEGCLSIPDLRGLTSRWRKIWVKGLDRNGKLAQIAAEDFHARVLQHEIDHLDGKVFLDRMRDFKSLAFTRELETFVLRRSAAGDPGEGKEEQKCEAKPGES